jgi:hypothetical protein
MFVQDQSGKIAGQLQWEHVNLSVEQALSMQTAAISLALRAAIADVQESVQRIEDKLDHVSKLLRSQRRGDALGDYRTLSNLAERVRSSGQVSIADWSTVASMGPEIGRDLEGLRSHLLALLERDDPGRTPWGRAEELQRILEEEWLEETLALLAIAEQNFNLWQEIRIAHVRASEPHHLGETIDDARRQLAQQSESDQLVLNALVDFATVVADPRLLDGLDPINARRLRLARDHLDTAVRWFAEQRLLDATPLATEPFPGFRQSARHLGRTTGRLIGAAASNCRGWFDGDLKALSEPSKEQPSLTNEASVAHAQGRGTRVRFKTLNYHSRQRSQLPGSCGSSSVRRQLSSRDSAGGSTTRVLRGNFAHESSSWSQVSSPR